MAFRGGQMKVQLSPKMKERLKKHQRVSRPNPLREKARHSPLGLHSQFQNIKEHQHALAHLGLSPSLPPEPESLAWVVEKAEFIMGELEKKDSPLADAVREIVDLAVLKEIVMGMAKSEDRAEKERLLEKLPGVLSALAKFANSGVKKKDEAPVAPKKELDQL